MMNEGRLIWSRSASGWYAYEHANGERAFFQATPVYRGYGWNLELVTRHADDVERESLGWHRYLKDAKRAADVLHQKRILEDEKASEGLKGYVRRYLIDPTKGTDS